MNDHAGALLQRAALNAFDPTQGRGFDIDFDPAATTREEAMPLDATDTRGPMRSKMGRKHFEMKSNEGAMLACVPPSMTRCDGLSVRASGTSTVWRTSAVEPAVPTANVYSPGVTLPGLNTMRLEPSCKPSQSAPPITRRLPDRGQVLAHKPRLVAARRIFSIVKGSPVTTTARSVAEHLPAAFALGAVDGVIMEYS